MKGLPATCRVGHAVRTRQPGALERTGPVASRSSSASPAAGPSLVLLLTAVVAFALLLPAGVTAGSASDPEFVDPDDVATNAAVDIVAGWVEESGTTLRFHLEVGDLGQGPAPGTTHSYAWSFRLDQTAYAAVARVAFGATGSDVDYWLADAQGDRVASLAGTYDTDEARLSWEVPRDLLGAPARGTDVADPWGEAAALVGGQRTARDRAPDANFGRTYTLQEGPDPAGGDGDGGGGGTGGTDGGTGTGDASAGAPFGEAGALGLGLLGLVAATVLLVWALRARAGGVALACEAPRQTTTAGRGTNFPLRVENRGRKPLTAELRTRDVPDGWVAFVPLPEVRLKPRQSRDLWVTLKAPADARPGQAADVTVRAEAREAPGRASEVRMRADVVGADAADAARSEDAGPAEASAAAQADAADAPDEA